MIPGQSQQFFEGAASALGGSHQIDRSLRFNAANTPSLNRTPSSQSNTKTWTYSCWVKRYNPNAGSLAFLLNAGTSTYFQIYFSADGFYVQNNSFYVQLSRKFRDVSAWYHIVIVVDTPQASASDRLKIYVNGELQTEFAVDQRSSFTQDTTTTINSTDTHKIGAQTGGAQHTNVYLAEAQLVDGTALAASDFGQTDANGVWQPKEYSGSYGTNGFYLKFADNSSDAALGTDSSGNGHTFTVTGINAVDKATTEVTAAWAGYVGSWSTTDTWASLSEASSFGNNGGTKGYSGTTESWAGDKSITTGDFGSSNRGGNGWAVRYPSTTTITIDPGAQGSLTDLVVCPDESTDIANGTSVTTYPATVTGQVFWLRYTGSGYPAIDALGTITNPGAQTADSLIDTPTNYSADTGNNGGNYATWNILDIDASITISNGSLDLLGNSDCRTRATLGMPSGQWYWECTIGDVPESNHVGVWATQVALTNDAYRVIYRGDGLNVVGGSIQPSVAAVTTGDVVGMTFDAATREFKLYKNNSLLLTLTAPALPDGSVYTPASIMAGTNSTLVANFGQRPFAYTPPTGFISLCTANFSDPTIADGSSEMSATLYSGDGTNGRAITTGHGSDLVWIKARNQTDGHNLFDILRGVTKVVKSNSTASELTESNSLTAFDSSGFTVGDNASNAQVNQSGFNYVAWSWDGGTSTASNTDGTITTSVRANTSAGFSIISYTGNGTIGATIGHGLGATPEFLIFKNRDDVLSWYVYHVVNGETKVQYLDSTIAATTNDFLNNTAPTSSVITLKNTAEVNANTQDIICYAWTSVSGYSSFGSYLGTGNSSTGRYVYTGFRPALIIFKAASTTSSWNIFDTARAPYNVVQNGLLADSANAEFTGTDRCDILSNGFRLRAGAAEPNVSGVTYVYMAWAEHPFKTARAR